VKCYERMRASERKEAILGTVKDLCSKKGFAGTTLDEIAKKSGVSRALVVQHFGSKEGLYEALMEYLFCHHPMEEDPNFLKRFADLKDDKGVFLAYCEHVYDHMAIDPEKSPLRLVFFSMLEKPDLYRKHFKTRKLKGIAVLEDYIKTRIADGDFRPVNATHLAQAFSALVTQLLFHGLILRTFHNKEEFMVMMQSVVEVFLNGLMKKDEGG